jgi:hypothetical protein
LHRGLWFEPTELSRPAIFKEMGGGEYKGEESAVKRRSLRGLPFSGDAAVMLGSIHQRHPIGLFENDEIYMRFRS